MIKQKSHKATSLEIASLDKCIRDQGCVWEKCSAPGAVKRARLNDAVITVYRSKKVLIQGKGTEELLRAVWPHTLEQQGIKAESSKLMLTGPYIGADESGKGDYFGPLVTAAVLVDSETEMILVQLGVKDCKALSDRKIREIYPAVMELCPHHAEVLLPAEYNSRYEKVNNLNILLASTHQHNIRQLVHEHRCNQVVVDQFAAEDVLMTGLDLPDTKIVQTPKAEDQYIGVAAASVVARGLFLDSMDALSARFDVVFPKGATNVLEFGRRLVQREGFDVLREVAKLHFRTTAKIKAGMYR